jgi:serine/threonine-protein kinase RsbW
MAQHIALARSNGTKVPEIASILLQVPAHKDYISIVRSAVSQLGACFGFAVGEIGDLRLAVDEACNLLVANRWPTLFEESLECRAEVLGDVIRVTLAAPAATTEPPDTEGFGWNILAALVDVLAWDQAGDLVRVELEKRRGTGRL